jgi:DNA helicase-2/ATP-dependent DNA helicase PcrA
VAGEAEAPGVALDWYLDLYRLFEAVRRQQGAVAFPDVREAFQSRFPCVLVDEFQDINLAQSEILDLLTAAHRNYTVIGDDDQTICQWRGANPRFILDFAQRYQAQRYVIDDNFRSTGALKSGTSSITCGLPGSNGLYRLEND